MITISTDYTNFPEILQIDGHENSSLGNHLLNFFFCCHLAYKHNYKLILPKIGNIERVLDPRIEYGNPPPRFYNESSVFQGGTDASYDVLQESLYLLNNGVDRDTTIKGLFWHYPLINLEAIFNYATFKRSDVKLNKNDVVIHIRGRDFLTHGQPHFKNLVPRKPYYNNAINYIKTLIKKPNLKVLTDDEPLSKIILEDHRYEIIDCESDVAWLLMKESKNLIASCSCFSWTASIFNKEILIQPLGGYNFENPKKGEFRQGFHISKATLINAQSK